MCHVLKIWYVGETFIRDHSVATWLPYWYSGTSLLKYYPPLFYFIALPFYLIFRDPVAAYKGITVLWFFLMSSSMYFVIYKRHGIGPAILASLIFITAPTNLKTYFLHGGLPEAFSFVFLPWIYYFSMRLVEEKEKTLSVIVLAVIIPFFVLAHAMIAAFSLISIFIALLIYQAADKARQARVIMSFLVASAIGLGLSAFWLVPSLLGRVMPAAQAGMFGVDSVPLSEQINIIAFHASPYKSYVPLSMLLLILLGFLLLRKATPYRIAFAGMGLFASVFAMGVRTPLYALIPLHDSLFPIRAMVIVVLAMAILAADIVGSVRFKEPIKFLYPAAIVLLIAILALDIYPALEFAKNKPAPKSLVSVLNSANGGYKTGRIWPYGTFNAEMSYYMPTITGKSSGEGFFYQGTEHYKEIAAISWLREKDKSPLYGHRKLLQWNTEYIILRSDVLNKQPALIPKAFREVCAEDGWLLFKTNKNPTFWQQFTRNSLVIGKYATTISGQFPWIAEGSENIDDYDWKYLSMFDQLVLSGFSFKNRKTAIDLLTRFVDNGGQAIIDLQGMTAEFGTESASFLDVLPTPIEVNGRPKLSAASTSPFLKDVDLELTKFSSAGETWTTVGYSMVDKSILDVAIDGKKISVLGTKRLGKGEVIFVGLNLFYHASISKDKNATRLLENLLVNKKVNKELAMPRFPVQSQQIEDDKMSCTYTSKRETPVVASTTWNDNWRAYIDGEAISVYEYENLPLLFLPAGRHTISLEYSIWTPLETLGRLISLVFVFVLGWLGYLVYKSHKPTR